MDDDRAGGAVGSPLPTLIEGWRAWRDALRAALSAPDAVMCLYSPDYAQWPIDDAVVVDGLSRWALSRRAPSVRMLARNFDVVQARSPRFVQWRVRFAHIVICRAIESGLTEPAEGILTGTRGLVSLRGARAWRATWVEGPALHAARTAFDAAWELSEPAFAPTIAGL